MFKSLVVITVSILVAASPPSQFISHAHGFRVSDTKTPTNEIALGLHTATFATPQGSITVNLPDDTTAGDTISGTVFTNPFGSTEAERKKNQDQLSGYVAEIERAQVRADKQSGSWLIPAGASVIPLVLKNSDRKEVGRVQIPINPSRNSFPISGQARYEIPSEAQAGKAVEIKGAFDGNFETTGVTIASQPARLLAESPRKAIAQGPANLTGIADLTVTENGRIVAQCAYRSIGVRLSAGKANLTRGETTRMNITVVGLEEFDATATLRLVNRSPGTVQIEGGEIQQLIISPKEVSGGSYTATKLLTGIVPGNFSINVMVERSDSRLRNCLSPGQDSRPVTALSGPASPVFADASPRVMPPTGPAATADRSQPRELTSRDLQAASQPQPVVPSLTTSGRFRVSLNSFKVNRQTNDNAVEGDGRGDEVFAMADIWEFEAGGRLTLRQNLRSRVMGDPVNYPTRVPAGSAMPGALDVGGVIGGLITDDVFPASPWRRVTLTGRDTLPMLLWEGELISTQNLAVIIPTLWEWDNPDRSPAERLWERWRAPEVIVDGGLSIIPGLYWPDRGYDKDALLRQRPLGHVGVAQLGSLVDVLQDGNRPIGQINTTQIFLKGLVIGFESASQIAARSWGVVDSSGRPVPGIIPIPYIDNTYLGNGHYTLFVQVERIN